MHKLMGLAQMPSKRVSWNLILYTNNTKTSVNVWHTVSFLQVISRDDVILRCLFDFSGQEGDELTIQANQVSDFLC